MKKLFLITLAAVVAYLLFFKKAEADATDTGTNGSGSDNNDGIIDLGVVQLKPGKPGKPGSIWDNIKLPIIDTGTSGHLVIADYNVGGIAGIKKPTPPSTMAIQQQGIVLYRPVEDVTDACFDNCIRSGKTAAQCINMCDAWLKPASGTLHLSQNAFKTLPTL